MSGDRSADKFLKWVAARTMRTAIVCVAALLVLLAAVSCTSQGELPSAVRFDSLRWHRNHSLPMAVDLIEGERLLALNKDGVIDLLGPFDEHLVTSNEGGLVPNLVLSYQLADPSYALSMTLTDGLVTEASIERRSAMLFPTTVLSGRQDSAPGGPLLSSGARERSLNLGGRPADGTQLWAVIGAAVDTEERAVAVLRRAAVGQGGYAQALTIQRAATVGFDESETPFVVVALYEDARDAQDAYAQAFRTPGLGRPLLELVAIGTRDPVPVVGRTSPQDAAFSPERWAAKRPAVIAISLANSTQLLGQPVGAVEDLLGAPDWVHESADSAGTISRLSRYELDNGEVLHVQYWAGQVDSCTVY